MLNMYTAKSVAFHFGRKVYLTLQSRIGNRGYEGCSRHIGCKLFSHHLQVDGAPCTIAEGTYRRCERPHLTTIVGHQKEVYGIGIFHRADG